MLIPLKKSLQFRLMKALYILTLSAIFLLSACNHNSKPTSSTAKVANKVIASRKINADTSLFCADYNDAGDYYADNGPTLIEYEHKRKGYFNGKTKVSEDYVGKYLYDDMWAISDTTVWDRDTTQETSADINAEYYLIKTVKTNPKYNWIVYEKLTDEESTKYFLTVDKKGGFISRIMIAWYGASGTFTDDQGGRQPYYTSISGCISQDGTIQLVDDRNQQIITVDNDTYKVHPDGQISRVAYFNNRDPSRKEYYDSLFKVDPNNIKAHLQYADMLSHEMKDVEAKKHFETALHLNRGFAETYDRYASALYQNFRDTLQAKRYYEKAIELEPKNSQYRLNYARLLCYLKDTLNAKTQYLKAVELSPENADVHYEYGYFLINYTSDKKEAKKQYFEAVKIDPRYKREVDSFGF